MNIYLRIAMGVVALGLIAYAIRGAFLLATESTEGLIAVLPVLAAWVGTYLWMRRRRSG